MAGGVLLVALATSARADREGTRNLGLTQSVGTGTTIWVSIEQPGETILICTSDDGFQEDDTDTGPVDQTPGAPNPVAAERQGAEIYAFPAHTPSCRRSADCPLGLTCIDRRRERPTDALAEDEIGPHNRCGSPLPVTGEQGHCTANADAENHHALVTDRPGLWAFDFAGEPETLGPGGRTTRYFEIEVLTPEGHPSDGGRVWSDQWILTGHRPEGASNAAFYAKVPVGGGAEVFVLQLSDFAAPHYTVMANPEGVHDTPRESACVFSPMADDTLCPSDGQARRNAYADHQIFLNFPSVQGATRPAPRLEEARFEDEIGTASLSPNGDDVQDTGTFSFRTNVSGRYAILLEVDRDGQFGSAGDVVLTGAAAPGLNLIPWDGRDAMGMPLPEGSYRLQLELHVAETHFPFTGIGDNATGFEIFHQTDGNQASRIRVPMFWDDTKVRARDHLLMDDVLTTHPRGSRTDGPPVFRRWRQPGWPDEERPVIFDTWVNAGVMKLNEVDCTRCGIRRTEIVIGGPDEASDRDDDGLSDEAEDANGNEMVDLGETDPDNPDTDGDGLGDGLETRSGTNPIAPDTDGDGLPDGSEDQDGDGVVDRGETDPRSADSDGDGLSDGAEDLDGDGRVNPGETDPRRPDTDGDGITDGLDPHPTIPESLVDAGLMDMLPTDGPLDGGAPTPIQPTYENDGGCEIGPNSPMDPNSLWLAVCLGWAFIGRRRRVSIRGD